MNVNKFLSVNTIYKLPKYAYYCVRCFFLFKKPFIVISHYIRKTSPKNKTIILRSGLKINLSDHPHDIVTVMVVFAKQDYGKVSRDNIVVDVGANIGVFSLFAASMGAKKIYAYEPNSKAYEVLLRNIADNKLEDIIVPRRLAVSDKDNEIIKIPIDSSPYNQIFFSNTECTEDINPASNIEKVSTTSLESILNNNFIDTLDLLKIDCEGMEYKIFYNSKDSVFSKINEIKMEYHEGPLPDLISYLEGHEFLLKRFDKVGQCLWFNKS